MIESGLPTALVVIPARGGSTGVPRKNLAPVGGVPLVVRAVRAAREAETVELVVVSTDDDEIADAAYREKATVIRRPSELATAVATSESAVHHVLTTLMAEGRTLPEVTVLVQCTSPFLESGDLDGVVRQLSASGADSCLTVSPSHAFLWRHGESGEAVAVNHDGARRLPRQQLEPQYVETGAAYAFRTAGFLESRSRFFGKTVLAVVDAHRTLEIDEPFDLRLACRWLEALEEERTRHEIPRSVRAVVFDFDGVMTDNRAVVYSTGDEGVLIDRSDGYGIRRLREETDLALLVLSTEENQVVRRRCDKLRIACISGVAEKMPVLARWLEDRDIDPKDCVYVGNDLNDMSCMTFVGYSVASSNAVPEIKTVADLVLRNGGGHGAVRELVDLLFAGGHVTPERIAGHEASQAR